MGNYVRVISVSQKFCVKLNQSQINYYIHVEDNCEEMKYNLQSQGGWAEISWTEIETAELKGFRTKMFCDNHPIWRKDCQLFQEFFLQSARISANLV